MIKEQPRINIKNFILFHKRRIDLLRKLLKENINGRPDIIVINHDKRVAIEIETGKSDAIGNIQRALNAGFDEVICVATNRYVEEKIRQELKRKNITDSRVKITSVFGFDIP